MFDVGFWELLVIFALGLLILGPERLPRVARTLGRWLGQARATVRKLQQEIEREIAVDDLRKSFEQEQRRNPPPPPPEGTRNTQDPPRGAGPAPEDGPRTQPDAVGQAVPPTEGLRRGTAGDSD